MSEIYSETDSDIRRNELLIGLGITAIGGLIGFLYQMNKNNRAKRSKTQRFEDDIKAGIEGALIGVLISLLAVVLYRAFFHGQSLYMKSKARQQVLHDTVQKAAQLHAAKLATSSSSTLNGAKSALYSGMNGSKAAGLTGSAGKYGSTSKINQEHLDRLREMIVAQ